MPYMRAPPYIVGIFLGWIVYKQRKNEFQLPWSDTKKMVSFNRS